MPALLSAVRAMLVLACLCASVHAHGEDGHGAALLARCACKLSDGTSDARLVVTAGLPAAHRAALKW